MGVRASYCTSSEVPLVLMYITTKYERLTPTYVRLTIRPTFDSNPTWDPIPSIRCAQTDPRPDLVQKLTGSKVEHKLELGAHIWWFYSTNGTSLLVQYEALTPIDLQDTDFFRFLSKKDFFGADFRSLERLEAGFLIQNARSRSSEVVGTTAA